ncbi:oligosaccharide flippase family protein [Marivirga arenosa]|uniref:Oligosaccharide flippase family protein n=1 Tax=Marivirga arenosa TaxID=3059076 RepID=A0AA51N7R4_9BACT|nr:oligosaccharide flippase family protein [Marivirga sp. ABR2-2]WMN07704.1 oligosaccharide flippase family protein [Marivirga sp. ABR2-2]
MIKNKITKLNGELETILNSFKTKGSFTRNFSYLFSGKLLTVVLSLVVTPILTRIYSPEAYGYFSFFNAVAMNFAVVSTLSYEKALIIINTRKKFYNLLFACFLLTFILAFILYLIFQLLYFREGIFKLELGLDQLFIHLIVIACILYSLTIILSNWNIRKSQFKFAAKNGVISQVGSRFSSLILGFISAPIFGLALSEIISKSIIIFSNFRKNIYSEWKIIQRNVDFNEMKIVIKEQAAYPKFILPSTYINTLINQLPIFFITLQFGKEILGHYSLAVSILYLPIIVITNSLSSVVIKRINELKDNGQVLKQFVSRITLLLFIVTTPFFIIMILASKSLFPFFFGQNWSLAGVFGTIIGFYAIIDIFLIFSNSLMLVFKKERVVFKYQILQLLCSLLGLLPGYLLNSFQIALIGYGMVYFIFGLIKVQVSYRLINLQYTIQFTAIFLLLMLVLFSQLNLTF